MTCRIPMRSSAKSSKERTETSRKARGAFEFFGGVPQRISYDNSKIAVAKIIAARAGSHERILASGRHYRLRITSAGAQTNEKGHVETWWVSRRNYLGRSA